MRVATFSIWLASATVKYVSRDLLDEGLVIEWVWDEQLSMGTPESRNTQFQKEMRSALRQVCAYKDLEKREYEFNMISTNYYKKVDSVCFDMSEITSKNPEYTLVRNRLTGLFGIEFEIEPLRLNHKFELNLGEGRKSLHFALTEGICPAGFSWECSNQDVVQTQTLVAGFEYQGAGGLFTCKRAKLKHSDAMFLHKDNVVCGIGRIPDLNSLFVGEAPEVADMKGNAGTYACTVEQGWWPWFYGAQAVSFEVDIEGQRIQRLNYGNADLTFKKRLLPVHAPKELKLLLVTKPTFLGLHKSHSLDLSWDDKKLKAACYRGNRIVDRSYPAQKAAIEVHRSEKPTVVQDRSPYFKYEVSSINFNPIYSDGKEIVEKIRYE